MPKSWQLLFLLLFITLGLVTLSWLSLPKNRFEVFFFDVGQGDSILVKTPGRYHIVVDGGPNSRVLREVGKRLPFWEKEIDLMVATHTDADHARGLLSLFDTYSIRKVWLPEFDSTNELLKELLRKAESENAVVEHPKAGDILKVSDGTVVKVVWPRSRAPQVPTSNDGSVVLEISYGDFDVLLTGDAESNTQPYIGVDAEVEVLKVPHHGSKDGLTKDYLAKISPEISIISAGKNNRYGHPDKTILQMLDDVQSKTYKTYEAGSITVESDGKTWYTRTER